MTTYYISSYNGDDANDGLSPATPWQTLTHLTSYMDNLSSTNTESSIHHIRLERGSNFLGQSFHIYHGGTPADPLTIDSYGDENLPLPHIDAQGSGIWHEDYHAPIGGSINHPHRWEGSVSTTLLLFDASYVEVRNLDISNTRSDTSLGFNDIAAIDRTGIAIIAQDKGTVNHVVLEGLHIHDVEGNVYDKHMANGGIYAIAHFPTHSSEIEQKIARFNNIHIRRNIVQRTRRWGIAVGYTAYLNFIDQGKRDESGQWLNRFNYGDGTISDDTITRYGSTNVVIEDNLVEDCGGDAITTMYCYQPIIRHNISRRAARDISDDIYTATDYDKVAAAIWPWRCKNALFEYNEAYDTMNADNGNGDGQAWDADFGDGTIYRYNFSSGNSGGTVMFCNEKAVNSQFYCNTAYLDHMGAIDIPRNPDAHIHHNVFILAKDCEPLRSERADGTALIESNIFLNNTRAPFDYCWHPQGSHVIWRSNRYIGFTNNPEED
ncbi:hypothetical protein EJ419_05885 [Alloscardovia theropitheci]|uniref:Right-handed parallel beta-helix repeat-containing protein n=1 Tax=Alloscardovia theropitheci TaxID=2496842 RepID=A0A4R0QWS1_9BIFI|nr:right-handed parallel beta-helix repeat-containing protein [Alloscardovia theropitheci]TCD53960.1 hypothetical protein EJ419_05885 [Alloscardovia theropitheci]